MKTPQSRIDDLVARPSEGLPVEIKSWIDPTKPEGVAKIVRACLAMRNQNGGFLVIGLNNDTLQVETVDSSISGGLRFGREKRNHLGRSR